MARLLNHSLRPSVSTSLSLVVCRLQGQPPCSDTLCTPPRCVTTHSTCLFLPFPTHRSIYCCFPPSVSPFFKFIFWVCIQTFSPLLHVLNPPHAVCHRWREERKMPLSTSEETEDKTVEQEKIVRSMAMSVFATSKALL